MSQAQLWPQLVSTALVGTQRRSPETINVAPSLVPLASSHPLRTPADVLGTVGALALARRAGASAVGGIVVPAPAPTDRRPLAPAAARERLRHLLNGSADAGFIELWLTLATARGLRVPGRDLAALFRAGRQQERLQPLVVTIAGARGAWLAHERPEWHWVFEAHTSALEIDDETVWLEGALAERVAYLATARRSDPARARELIASVWSQEPPAERAAMIAVLADRLGTDDEAFCEAALDDRRKEVRAAAASLLAAIDGSSYQRRMAERAFACVAEAASGDLVVTPPSECDTSMKRDGIEAKPPANIGERAWWFEQVIASTPLSTWSANQISMPVADGWAPSLRRGWAQAAHRRSNSAWAAALLTDGFGRGPFSEAADRMLAESLYSLLTSAVAVGLGLQILADPTTPDGQVKALLNVCPRPWPRPLASALLTYLRAQVISTNNYVPAYLRDLGNAIVVGLDPQTTNDVAAMAASVHEASPALTSLMETLVATASTRHQILQEFA